MPSGGGSSKHEFVVDGFKTGNNDYVININSTVDLTVTKPIGCPLLSQFVFAHHSCHYVAHFRIAHSLDLCLRQQVLACYVLDMDFDALTFVAGAISTPADFLKTIGRSSETKISFDTWDDLWKTNGRALKKAGLATRDRRYVAFAKTMSL